MFVTFYSYKGGVGRTLAVANVAYLLASDEEEPCRVLIWDFDLESPGLHRVFECKWEKEKVGFVDFVHEYITKAEIPDIREYIHPTDVEGVDILPAGDVGPPYSEKLEAINWRDVYDRRRGEDLMDRIRSDIAHIGSEDGYPTYDYVLIDSRTGYSDVGGICVHQLPDAVVLMFRLNEQNIAGISEVRDTIRAYAGSEGGREIEIVPVISPAWPFGATEAKDYIDRARSEFGDQPPLTITFEAALTYGERIITRDQNRYGTDLRICHDYEQLTRRLRRLNSSDPLTMTSEAASLSRRGYAEQAFDVFRELVGRDPDRPAYWQDMITSFDRARASGAYGTAGPSERVTKFLDTFIEEHPDSLHAVLARARWRTRSADDPQGFLQDYARAVELAPNDAQIRLERASVYMDLRDYEAALHDLDHAVEASPSDPDLLLARARCFERLGDAAAALGEYDAVMALRRGDDVALRQAVRLAFGERDFERALSWLERAPKRGAREEYATLLQVHTLAALGRKEQAAHLLGSLRSEEYHQSDLNIAEALIVTGNLPEANSVLKAIRRGYERLQASMLQAIVHALEGNPDAGDSVVDTLLATHQVPLDWNFIELTAFLDTASERGDFAPETTDTIRSWIRQLSASPDPRPDRDEP